MEACEGRFAEIGLISNLLIGPLDSKPFTTDAELAEELQLANERATATDADKGSRTIQATPTVWVVLAGTAVCVPLIRRWR